MYSLEELNISQQSICNHVKYRVNTNDIRFQTIFIRYENFVKLLR